MRLNLEKSPEHSGSTPGEGPGVVGKSVSALIRMMAIVAGIAIVGVACLIVANVVLRFFTGAVIFGVDEIIQVAMVPVVFLAIGYCGQIGGHITVDLFETVFPKSFWRVVDPVIRLGGAVAFLALALQAGHSGNTAGDFGEYTNLRRIPLQPVWYTLAVGAAFAALIEFSKLFKATHNWSVLEEDTNEH